MNRSIRPGGGLGHQEKKGPWTNTVSRRGKKKKEAEMANERMNRAGGGDDDDDGKHTKNTYLPTYSQEKKERERRQSAYSTQMIILATISYILSTWGI